MRLARPTIARAVAAAALLWLAAATGAGSARGADAPPRWTYAVTVAPDLSTLSVRWCVEGYVPRRAWLADVTPLDTVTLGAATGATWARDPADPPIALVEGAGARACFDYTVDVEKAIARRDGRRVGRALVLRTGAFLLRGGLLPDDLEASARFHLPAGFSTATPWPADGVASYRLPASTWPFQGWVAIGPLERERFTVAGCDVDLVRLDGPLEATAAALRAWISRAVETDALLFGGRFPRRTLFAAVEPARPSNEPVVFGSAWMGGGAHAFLFVARNARDPEFREDWTAVHELIHTALPHVRREDAWLAEGFVTYYQEVLRARAGTHTPLEAWREIESGFSRGRRSKSTDSIEGDSRAMYARHEFHRVYWAGAAIALLLDVEARRASGGRTTLDDLMRDMLALPGADRRSLTAAEVVASLDRRLGGRRASRLVTPLLASSDFPDVAPTYRDLGLRVTEHGVDVVPGAPLAAIRDAIMAAPLARADGTPQPAIVPAGSPR
jgi:hypothetical protein